MQNVNNHINEIPAEKLQWDNSAENALNFIATIILVTGILLAIAGGIATGILLSSVSDGMGWVGIIVGIIILLIAATNWGLLQVISTISLGVKDISDKVEGLGRNKV